MGIHRYRRHAQVIIFTVSILFSAINTAAAPHSTYPDFAQPIPEFYMDKNSITFPTDQSQNSITLTITDTAIYRYVQTSFDGQSWTTLTVPTSSQCTVHPEDTTETWLTGTCTLNITPLTPSSFNLNQSRLTATRNYITTYSCTEVTVLGFRIAWDCHGNSTIPNMWQIHQFDASLEEQEPPPSWLDGLVSWWKLDGNADDSVGDNHGTINYASPTGTDCVSGTCYAFDGIDDYADFGNDESLNIDSNITVSAWIKQNNDVTQSHHIVSRNSLGGGGYVLFSFSNYPYFYVYNSTGQACKSYRYVKLGNGWRHLTGVYNGTHTLIYVNGNLWDITPCDPGFVFAQANANLRLAVSSYSQYFNGSIDEVMVWKRALTGPEVSELHDFYGYEPPTTCGNGTCDKDETCSNCPDDCGCLDGEICSNGVCLIETSGNTYFVSKDGSDSNPGTFEEPWLTITHCESKMSGGDICYIREGTYNERLRVYGLTGATEENPTIFSAYNGEGVVIDGNGIEMSQGTALVRTSNDYNQFIGLEVKNSNRQGIMLDFDSDYSLIRNCTAHNITSSGITALGNYNVIEYCTVYDACMSNSDGVWQEEEGETWGAGMNVRGTGNVARHNTIHNIWGEALSITRADYGTIEDNVIYDGYSVYIYIMNAKNSLIQRNLVYMTERQGDGANVGIGHWNEEWVGGHENENNTIINNMVYGCRRNFYNGCPMTGTLIANNVFVNSVYMWSVQITGDPHTSAEIRNNIIIQEDELPGIYATSDANVIYSNNLYNKAYDSDAVGIGDIVANPRFAKVGSTGAGELSGEYFKLLSDSPAIDAGTFLASVIDDYFKNPRDDNPDIGAHEYQ